MSELRAIFRGPGQRGTRWAPPGWGVLARKLPGIEIDWTPGARPAGCPSLPLWVAQWESPNFNFHELDRRLDDLAERDGGPFAIDILGSAEELARSVGGILTRCQRWSGRRNEVSRNVLFDGALALHRNAHDLAKPLVRADYDHALDTWQWLLRLAPAADLALQLAALFHDIERLASEADARVEHQAVDYQAFKDEHAERGAERTAVLLTWIGADAATRERTARLIARHEHLPVAGDPDGEALSLLNEADALSFFSLNSAGYLDYFGPEATRRKVAYTLRRLRPRARRHLDGLCLRPAVAAAIAGELDTLAA